MHGEDCELSRIARELQRGGWTIGEMPARLGIKVGVFPGGAGLLGMCGHGPKGARIALSDRVIDTVAEHAALTHELAHLLQERPALACCTATPRQGKIERMAWRGAARLSVSVEQTDALLTRRLSVLEVARQSGVPVGLVNIQLAAGMRDETMIEAALDDWIVTVHRITQRLRRVV